MPAAQTPAPSSRGRAAALLGLEGAVLLALAVVAGLATAAGQEAFRGAALGLAAVTAGAGLLVLGLGLALLRGAGWPRTPALVIQLVALPVGTDQLLGRQWVAGTVVLLLAGATAWHLLAIQRDPQR